MIATTKASNDQLRYLLGSTVVVVDDAFDPPTSDAIDADAIQDFLDQSADDEGISRDLEARIQSGVKAAKDFNQDLVDRLWEIRDEETPLAELCCNTIFSAACDNLANLTPFCKHLRSLGFDVTELGQEGEIPTSGVKLLLVDYVLGPEVRTSADEVEALARVADSVRKSEALVKRFYQSFPNDADKPFIVLMSTRSKGDVQIEEFEEHSDLLRGTFDFVTKGELCDLTTLEFKLRVWNHALPARHDIQHFVEALSGAVVGVMEKFRRALRQLSFQDYTYIQSLALQDDGHPLGDYMLWLYSSFLEDLILSDPDVLKQRQKLDAMEFPNFLPTEEPPAAQLAQLYQKAVGSVAAALDTHPREAATLDLEGVAPYAQLGDVFVRDANHEVYMVLNAACDLAFAPNTGRKWDPERAIMLIPGELTPLFDAPANMSHPRTDLFAVDSRLFRVIWRDDRVFSFPHKDLFQKMKESGHERRHRLRLPYALLVQHAFASKLTRVGLPVAPPICVAVDVEVRCADDFGNSRMLCPPVKGGAVIIHRKQKNDYVQELALTAKCIKVLLGQLEEVAEQQLRLLPTAVPAISGKNVQTDDGKRAARRRKKSEEVLAFKQRHDFWFSLVQNSRPLPAAGSSVPLAANFLSLYRNATFDDAWGARPYIALNVQYGCKSSPEPVVN